MRTRLRSRLSPRRFVPFAVAAALLVFGAAFLALLGADVYLHKKYESTASVNVWGYRGPAVGRKAPGEFRVAVLGAAPRLAMADIDESFPYRSISS